MPEKPLTLDAICLMELKDIEKTFPYGALVQKTKGKQERFRPAEEGQKPDRTRAWLLKKKRDQDRPLFMLRGSPQPRLRWSEKERRWVESGDWGVEEHGYTHSSSKALDDEGPPPAVVDAYAEENWQRFLGDLENINSRNGRLYARRRVQRKAA